MQDFYSTAPIDYDVIFIGPLAAVVCNLLQKLSSQQFKYLIISDKKSIICSSLLPSHNPVINIQKQCPKNVDHEISKIVRIWAQ